MNILYLQDHVDFTLEANETLSGLGLKSAQNLESDYILKTAHIKHNCNDRLIIDITDMVPLSSVYKGLNDAMVINVMEAIADVFNLVSNKAFLEREFILMDMEHLYIDRKESRPKFMILPYSVADGSSAKEWYSQVITTVSALLYGRDTLSRGRFAKISNAIGDISKLPAEDVLELMNAKKKVVDAIMEIVPEGTSETGFIVEETPVASNNLALRYRGTMGEFAFYITKPMFYIGKSQEMDGVLSFNPTVSRKHAVVHIIEGRSYLEDLGSRNGTFLNGYRCEVGKKYPLSQGNIVRIADMEFLVEM